MWVAIARLIGPRRLAHAVIGSVVVGALLTGVGLLVIVGALTGASVTSAAAAIADPCTPTTSTNTSTATTSTSSSPPPTTSLSPAAVSPTSLSLSGLVTVNASWDASQVQVAQVIVARGIAAGVGARGAVVAVMVAIRESGLRNLDYGDRDSLGVFQQRPSMGWGTPTQVRDVVLAADAFYGVARHTANPGLVDIPGWQQMPLGDAGQAVQHSGFPSSTYGVWEPDARQLVQHLLARVGTVVDCTGTSGPSVISGQWAHPMLPAPYRASSPFGPRRDPVTGVWRVHHGFDMAAPTGTPIRAACTGVVVATNPADPYGGGRQTTIDCGGGVSTIYMHQSAFLVTPGQHVTAGTVIGRVGSTGHSTGPHLHFQVDVDGRPVEPVEFMRQKGIQL